MDEVEKSDQKNRKRAFTRWESTAPWLIIPWMPMVFVTAFLDAPVRSKIAEAVLTPLGIVLMSFPLAWIVTLILLIAQAMSGGRLRIAPIVAKITWGALLLHLTLLGIFFISA